MHFLNSLGFIFSLIIPLIILLYLLKRRYQEHIVSSTFLWEQVLRDVEANRPWQRLKKNLLLFLQLLVAAFLILAISRPYIPLAGMAGCHIVAVIDCSASMMAEDIKPSRFSEAKSQLRQLIDSLGKNEKMTILTMAEHADVLINNSNDRSRLYAALDSIEAGRGSADLDSLFKILASYAREDNLRLVVFSDGSTLPTESDIKVHCPVDFHKIGQSGDNLAISTLSGRRDGNRVLAMARLSNYGNKEAESSLLLSGDQGLLDVRQVKLAANEVKEILWDNLPADTRTIQANLDIKDSFSLDNQNTAIVEQLFNKRALLVTEGNIFLEKALLLVPGLELYRAKPLDYCSNLNDYQLYIFDSYIPEYLPDGGIMLLDPPSDNSLLEIKGEINAAKNIRPLTGDALLKYMQLDSWQAARAKKVDRPSWANTILDCEGSPLLMSGELKDNRVVIFSFDLHESNIPLQTGFPILINRLTAWLLPEQQNAVELDAVSNTFEFKVLSGTEEVILEKPDGQEIKFSEPFPLLYPANEAGIYRIHQLAGEKEVLAYVSKASCNPFESDINPRELAWGGHIDKKENLKKKINYEIWNYLAWLAIALLLLEWEVYRRGY